MKAIQTRYAGCHFRSRLEARWAVFFDTVGIRWEYESQGFMCPYELTPWRKGEFPYLPDFWLPDLNVFAEVKGSTESGELWKVLHSAAHFSKNGADLLFLGHFPQPDKFRVPFRLQWHEGDLHGAPWLMDWPFRTPPFWDWPIVQEYKLPRYSQDETWTKLLNMTGVEVPERRFFESNLRDRWFRIASYDIGRFERGYEEARSARF